MSATFETIHDGARPPLPLRSRDRAHRAMGPRFAARPRQPDRADPGGHDQRPPVSRARHGESRRRHRHGRRDRSGTARSRRARPCPGSSRSGTSTPARSCCREGHPQSDRAGAQLRRSAGRAVQGRGVLRGQGRASTSTASASTSTGGSTRRAASSTSSSGTPRSAIPFLLSSRGLRVPLEQPRHRPCRAGLQRDPLGRGGARRRSTTGSPPARPRPRSCGTTRTPPATRGCSPSGRPATGRAGCGTRARTSSRPWSTSTSHAACPCRSSSSTSSTGPGTASGGSTRTSGPTPPAWWRGCASAASA